MSELEFKAAVGMSRKWDAREAGREVAIDTLNKLGKDVKPKFFILLSTIHYEKHGGFQEFLDGVWEVLPEGTPLIGGTVAGFMNSEGCYTRGATALAVNFPAMDIAVGMGKNTKRNPRKSARDCSKRIKEGLHDSHYTNKFIFNLISAGMVPQIPGMGRRKIIRGVVSKIAILLSSLSLKTVQKGVGCEDEILDVVIPEFKDYSILSGSSMGKMDILANYQFYGNKVFSNALVALGMTTNLNCDISSSHCLKKTGKKLHVTKFRDGGRIVSEINNKPAVPELLKILGWPEDYIDERVYRKIFYYPLSFDFNQKVIPEVIGLFLGDSFLGTYMIKSSEVNILSASGKNLLEAVDENLNYFQKSKPLLGLISSCGIRLETLGSATYKVWNKLTDFFKNTPFLLYYVGGEAAYTPTKGLFYGNDTFNMGLFWEEDNIQL